MEFDLLYSKLVKVLPCSRFFPCVILIPEAIACNTNATLVSYNSVRLCFGVNYIHSIQSFDTLHNIFCCCGINRTTQKLSLLKHFMTMTIDSKGSMKQNPEPQTSSVFLLLLPAYTYLWLRIN
jgi:hypothetical protein